MTREKELAPDAAHVLRVILDHELRSRPRANCLIATPRGAGLRRDDDRAADEHAPSLPTARN